MKSLFVLLLFNFLCINTYADEENLERHAEKENSIEEETALLDPSLFSPSFTSFKELELQQPVLPPPSTKSPALAVGLSTVIPGLGHTYLGDMKTATALFGSSGMAFGLLALSDENKSLELSGILTFQNISLYGIYAAYRDARKYNRDVGYFYKMPVESFTDLSLAPLSLSVLKKPEVWGGLIGALSIGAAIGYFAFQQESAHIRCDINYKNIQPIFAFPVGIGEETFFRGYLQSALAEIITPIGAIALTSLVFGAAHLPTAQLLPPEDRWRYYSFSIPLITSLGAYFGWLTYKNQSLKESVALHVWYDFVIFLGSAFAVESAIAKKPRFAISIPF